MGVNGGPGVWTRLKEAYNRNWPWSRSTSSRDGNGTVIFASTSEVLTFVYRPNLSVRDICTEAAVKVDISPVALDFFTLVHVTENGSSFLNPNKVLSESECSQVYFFKLCIKACHGMELKDFDKKAFEYYFHQCRQEFLSGELGEFSDENQNILAQLVLYEIIYLARRPGVQVQTKDVIDNPGHYRIKKLLQRGIFAVYPLAEKKRFLRENVTKYEVLTDHHLKSDYISALEKAEDFFVYKFSFEKVYVQVSRKFEVLISAEFGIKKRRLDIENSLPEVIVEKFSDIQGLEFDRMRNVVRILRKEFKTEELTASSTQDADSLMTLVEGYYRVMVNQYKQLNLRGSRHAGAIPCHGPISRKKAEDLLLKGPKEDGSFLLRRKRNNHWNRVLSVYVADKVMNYDIIWDDSINPGFFRLKDAKREFSDMPGLVQHYKQTAGGLPVCLKEIIRPNTEGLDALLDRQIIVPAVPEVRLLNKANQIDNLKLEAGNSLSEWGEFGEVKKGSWFCASAEEELSVISRAMVKPIGREKIRQFNQAMGTFLELQNPYLPQFYGTTETEKALIFVFEFAAEGPLDQYIKNESMKKNGITKGRVISYAAQIAEGMMFLHSKNCVHGRLNAHNVLVSNEECIKISDFGLLYLVQNGQSFYHSISKGYGYCWFSPQSLRNHTFTEESDIWTFGVTLWEMFAMKRPFHCSLTAKVLPEEEVMNRYLQGLYLNPDRPNCPPSVGSLVRRCCAPKPKERMSFRQLVTELRSPELVSDDQAQDILLQPEIKQLEDWEIILQNHLGNLELEALPNDSQTSNGDYSCLPENVVQDEDSANDDHTHNLPGISLISSISQFDNTSSRKHSLSKTFSHPGLVHAYEAERTLPSEEPFSFLPVRKPSITRVSSCPPSIQAGNDNNEQSEPTERLQKEGYVPCPHPSAEEEVPSLNQKELQMLVTGMEDPDTVSSEELVESDGSSSEDNSTDDGGAEAMAMRSLAKHLPKTSIQETTIDSLPSDVETQPDLLSVHSVDDAAHNEEGIEWVSKSGSSAYITLESETSSQSSLPVHHTEEKPEKSRAGSYVTLTTATKGNMSQKLVTGSSIQQRSSAAHSTVDKPLVPVQSIQPPVSNTAATGDIAAKCSSLNAENQTPCSPDLCSYQNQPRIKETSQLKDGGISSVPCKSPDELLGSLSQDNNQNGMGSLGLTNLLPDIDDGSFEEEPSPLITDLQEENEGDDGDSRGDAELSLGMFSLPVSNVGLELNKVTEQTSFSLEEENNHFNSQPHTDMESAKESNITNELDQQEESTLSEESQLSLGKFHHPMSNIGLELSSFSDQSPSTLEEEQINYNLQPFADKKLDTAKVSEDYISNQELFQHSQEENDTLLKENQESDSSQGFNPFQFLATNNSSTGLTGVLTFMPELTHDGDWGEESDPDNEDACETSDIELGSLCAPVGYSPGKIKSLNCPLLEFDQAQEKLEMKEFSLNNLSKGNLKSSEFPVFEEDHFLCEEISSLCSNQLDDAHNEDGCSLNGDLESECGVRGNIWVDPSCKEMSDLKETTGQTPGTSEGDYIDKEEQLLRNMGNYSVGESFHRQAPDKATEEEEDEPIASLSRSSSSQGIWPSSDAMARGYQQRTSTIDSCSSGGDEPITLDMSKIPQQLQIPCEQLQILGKLGQGQFGEVNQATIVSTDSCGTPKREDVAVKVLRNQASQKDSSDFIREVQNMIELESKQQCPYIIKLRGVAKDPYGKLMLVTELAPLGSLQTYLPKNKDILQIPQLLEFCMQICKGMQYLECKQLLHKDLATRNILVMREDLVKISDFGLSRLQDYYKIQESSKVPVKWYALESLVKKRFTTKSDVWSFGVTMWEIFSYGDKPYDDLKSTELCDFLEAGNRLARPDECPPEVHDVMCSCWLEDASKRPTFYLLETNYLATLLETYPVSGL